MTQPIAKDTAGYAYRHPLDTALLATAPFTGLLGEEGAAEAAPKNLPIIEPGANTEQDLSPSSPTMTPTDPKARPVRSLTFLATRSTQR